MRAFIALTVLIVYVGAVAVLVLFVCMLLETKLVEIRSISHVSDLLFAGYIIVFCLLSILGDFSYVYLSNINSFSYEEYLPWIVFFGQISVLNALSIVLYVYYGIFLVVTSYILLIALIGAVVLTLYHRGNVRRQNVFKQMYHELGVLNNRRVVAK
jgi:NADH-quinone oxidoreductase subunit J